MLWFPEFTVVAHVAIGNTSTRFDFVCNLK